MRALPSRATMTFISLFSGIGGFDLGFERAGMQCAAQIEIDAKARAVLNRHFPAVPVMEDVRHAGKHNLPTVDVIAGGFPCQDVSVAGNRQGLAGERSGLWFEFLRIVTELTPKWVVIENVPGLLSSNRGRDFAVILHGLVGVGYRVGWRVLDAQYFGLAQRRKRVFIVASLGDGRAAEVLFEREGGAGDIEPRKETGQEITNCSDGISGAVSAKWAKRNGGPSGDERYNLVVIPTWEPCPDCDDYWCNRHGMHAYDCSCPEIDYWDIDPYSESSVRRLMPSECERLQGIPDDWTDGQTDSTRYRQIGNATAVPVAEWLGRRIREAV